jgi:hypothetical protein
MTQVSTIGTFSQSRACRRRGCTAGVLYVLLAGGILVALLGPLAAGTGDKKGWSVVTDPRKRAFLIWTPAANGPRVLTFGCLRDVDSFTVLSQDTIGRSTGATLTVSNGTARFEVAGDVASDSVVGRPTFTGENCPATENPCAISRRDFCPCYQAAGIFGIRSNRPPNAATVRREKTQSPPAAWPSHWGASRRFASVHDN